jgi:CRP-like cAMP-binding protein
MAEPVGKLLALARHARELGQHEAALLIFRRICELDGTNVEANAAVADLCEELERHTEALEARIALAECYIDSGKLTLASEVVGRILAAEPEHPTAARFREFIDRRLNPERSLDVGAVPEASDDEMTTSRVEVPDLTDPEDEWDERTTGVISPADVKALLAGARRESQAEAGAGAGDDFAAPERTIALGGTNAAMSLAGLIQTSPLLRALDSSGCTRLLSEGEVIQCFNDQVIVERGAEASSLLLLLEGAAAIERDGRTLETIAAGDFFGEAAVLGATPRIATLRVTGGDALFLEIDRPAIRSLSIKQPLVIDVLAHVLRRRAITIGLAESLVLSRVPPALFDEVAPLLHLHRIKGGDRVESKGGRWVLIAGELEGEIGETITAAGPSWLLELPAADLKKMIARYPRLVEVLG